MTTGPTGQRDSHCATTAPKKTNTQWKWPLGSRCLWHALTTCKYQRMHSLTNHALFGTEVVHLFITTATLSLTHGRTLMLTHLSHPSTRSFSTSATEHNHQHLPQPRQQTFGNQFPNVANWMPHVALQYRAFSPTQVPHPTVLPTPLQIAK